MKVVSRAWPLALAATWPWLVAAVVAGGGDGIDYGKRPPKLAFESMTIDFGKLRSDQGKVGQDWVFRNDGDEPLRIEGTRPSCGCTATVVADPEVPGGSQGVLRVTFDPSEQHGTIRKSLGVISNDPDQRLVLLTVKAFVESVQKPVEPGAHPPITGQSLLMGNCASCHAKPAGDKKGAELYEAVCATCHGPEGLGALAPGLRDPAYLASHSDDDLAARITYGTSNPRMPGYGRLMGGPLDDVQVRSLVRLIRSWGPRPEPGASGKD